jgi:hypothetical protein
VILYFTNDNFACSSLLLFSWLLHMVDVFSDFNFILTAKFADAFGFGCAIFFFMLPIISMVLLFGCRGGRFFVFYFDLLGSSINPKDKEGTQSSKVTNHVIFVLIEDLP